MIGGRKTDLGLSNQISLNDELKSAEELILFLEGKLEGHEKNL